MKIISFLAILATLATLAMAALALLPQTVLAAPDKQDVPGAQAAENVTPAAGETKIRVSGVVCSFCSQGLVKKLSKLPFVDQSKYKNGVHVSIEDQLVTIAIKPDTTPDLALIYAKIKSGGYEPSKAWVADHAGAVSVYDAGGALWVSGR